MTNCHDRAERPNALFPLQLNRVAWMHSTKCVHQGLGWREKRESSPASPPCVQPHRCPITSQHVRAPMNDTANHLSSSQTFAAADSKETQKKHVNM